MIVPRVTILGDTTVATRWVGYAKKIAVQCYANKIVSKVLRIGSDVKIRVENIFSTFPTLGSCKVRIDAQGGGGFLVYPKTSDYLFGIQYSVYPVVSAMNFPYQLDDVTADFLLNYVTFSGTAGKVDEFDSTIRITESLHPTVNQFVSPIKNKFSYYAGPISDLPVFVIFDNNEYMVCRAYQPFIEMDYSVDRYVGSLLSFPKTENPYEFEYDDLSNGEFINHSTCDDKDHLVLGICQSSTLTYRIEARIVNEIDSSRIDLYLAIYNSTSLLSEYRLYEDYGYCLSRWYFNKQRNKFVGVVVSGTTTIQVVEFSFSYDPPDITVTGPSVNQSYDGTNCVETVFSVNAPDGNFASGIDAVITNFSYPLVAWYDSDGIVKKAVVTIYEEVGRNCTLNSNAKSGWDGEYGTHRTITYTATDTSSYREVFGATRRVSISVDGHEFTISDYSNGGITTWSINVNYTNVGVYTFDPDQPNSRTENGTTTITTASDTDSLEGYRGKLLVFNGPSAHAITLKQTSDLESSSISGNYSESYHAVYDEDAELTDFNQSESWTWNTGNVGDRTYRIHDLRYTTSTQIDKTGVVGELVKDGVVTTASESYTASDPSEVPPDFPDFPRYSIPTPSNVFLPWDVTRSESSFSDFDVTALFSINNEFWDSRIADVTVGFGCSRVGGYKYIFNGYGYFSYTESTNFPVVYENFNVITSTDSKLADKLSLPECSIFPISYY